MRKVFLRALLILGGVIFSLLLLEAGLRISGYAPTWSTDEFKDYYAKDEEAGHDIFKNLPKRKITVDAVLKYDLWSNELGCFDTPFQNEKNPILLVGDSYTHAVAPFEDKWGTVIEKELGIRVLKCGVSGYGPRQETIKAERVIKDAKTKPRLIIVGYLPWNDIVDDIGSPNSTVINGYLSPATRPFDLETGAIERIPEQELLEMAARWGNGPPPAGEGTPLAYRINYWLNSHSALIRTTKNLVKQIILSDFLGDKFGLNLMKRFGPVASTGVTNFYERLFYASKKDWFPQALESHLDNFRTFQNIAKANDAELLVVIIPTKEQIYPFLPRTGWDDAAAGEIQKNILAYFDENKIAYLDLLPILKKEANETPREWVDSEKDFYWRFDSHWSGFGNIAVGLIVSEYLIQEKFVEVEGGKLEAIESKLKSIVGRD